MGDRLLKEHNDLLRRELGSNPMGEGLYMWARAGDCTYLGRIIDPLTGRPSYDYNAQSDGLIAATEHLEPRKMCPELDDQQWVLMRWLENPGALWFQFGRSYYMFTDVHLESGIEPWTTHRGLHFTEHVIGAVKELRKTTRADLDNATEDRQRLQEKQKLAHNKDIIQDAWGAFSNIPGSHGNHVEFGGIGESRPFIAPEDTKKEIQHRD